MVRCRPRPRHLIAFLTLIGAAAALAAAAPAPLTEADYKVRFDAAIALHDRGQYEAAIAAFRDLLAVRPDHPDLLCEMASSCLGAGRADEAVRHAERGLGRPGANHAFCSNVLGSALDAMGDLKRGEKVFRKAIKESPAVPILRFNLGVNQAKQGRSTEAIEAYQQALRLDSRHAGSWRALAIVWQEAGNRPRAFAAFARFLTLEPEGARAEWAAKQLGVLMWRGVENRGVDPATGKERIDITLDSALGKKDKAAGPLDVGMAIVAAGRWLEEWKDRPDGEFFAHAFASSLTIFEEMGGAEDARGESPFWKETVLPYFRAANAAGHLETMAWDVRRSLKDREIDAWLAGHPERVEEYRSWSRDWKPSGAAD